MGEGVNYSEVEGHGEVCRVSSDFCDPRIFKIAS